MVGKSRGLGKKGLDSVFGGKKEVSPALTKNDSIAELEVKALVPNPYQPRKTFNPEKMQDLINSVRESGVIQPLIVRKAGSKYEIVAGERRWRAAKEVGLKKVPVVVRKYDEAAMKEVALVENLQRSDLNPLEEALGIQALIDDLKLTQAEAGKRLGKSRAAITNALRLLNLPKDVQEFLVSGALTAGQVRPLLGLEDGATISKLAQKAAKEDWTTKIMEEFVAAEKQGGEGKLVFKLKTSLYKDPKETKKTKKVTAVQDVHVADYEEQLIDYLGTKVTISPNKNAATGGRIVIEYYNVDDLARLSELLQPPAVSSTKASGAKKFTI